MILFFLFARCPAVSRNRFVNDFNQIDEV